MMGRQALGKLAKLWGVADPAAAEQKALTSYCHAMMNSAGFLYVD
jgi:hypothetical protein